MCNKMCGVVKGIYVFWKYGGNALEPLQNAGTEGEKYHMLKTQRIYTLLFSASEVF